MVFDHIPWFFLVPAKVLFCFFFFFFFFFFFVGGFPFSRLGFCSIMVSRSLLVLGFVPARVTIFFLRGGRPVNF